MIVVEAGFTGTSYALDYPRIAAHFIAGTPSASTEATGYDAEFAADLNDFTGWQPTAMPAHWALTFDAASAVSAFGVFGHNLGTVGATLVAKRWDGAAWQDVISHTPTDDSPILGLMTRRTGLDRWRFDVTGAAVPTIAGFAVCDVIELPQKANFTGSESFEHVPKAVLRQSVSQGGRVLQNVIERQAGVAEMTVRHLPETFKDAMLVPLRQWMQTRPVFMADRPSKRPKSVVFGIAKEEPQFGRDLAKSSIAINTTFRVVINDGA